jgi:hypothetical protein
MPGCTTAGGLQGVQAARGCRAGHVLCQSFGRPRGAITLLAGATMPQAATFYNMAPPCPRTICAGVLSAWDEISVLRTSGWSWMVSCMMQDALLSARERMFAASEVAAATALVAPVSASTVLPGPVSCPDQGLSPDDTSTALPRWPSRYEQQQSLLSPELRAAMEEAVRLEKEVRQRRRCRDTCDGKGLVLVSGCLCCADIEAVALRVALWSTVRPDCGGPQRQIWVALPALTGCRDAPTEGGGGVGSCEGRWRDAGAAHPPVCTVSYQQKMRVTTAREPRERTMSMP